MNCSKTQKLISPYIDNELSEEKKRELDVPEDGFKMDHRMGDILSLPEVQKRIQNNIHYLVYFLPRDYIMQCMIADTGGQWKLSIPSDTCERAPRHVRRNAHASG